MKFSELSTDRALDVLCEITPYLSNIAADESVIRAIGKIVDNKGMNLYGSALLMMERLGEMIPSLFKTHREDVYGILSVVNEKGRDEIAAQNVLETLRQAREIFRDPELIHFFRSSAQQAATGSSAPSAGCPA